jgi:hypothetical protein
MKKVLIGCAIVVAVVLLLGIGGGFYVFRSFQNAMGDREAQEAIEAKLAERDGPLTEQHPPLDGLPTANDVAAYVRISRAISPRLASSGHELRDFVLQIQGKQNPLRRAVQGVRGSIDLTRNISTLNAHIDSLLLETGISEGNLAYVYALHRYGILGWQPPSLDEAEMDSSLSRKARREMNEAIEGVETQVEDGIGELLRRQRAAIDQVAELTPELEESKMWLDRVLEARSLFDALRHEGARESQRRVFAEFDAELSALAPATLGGYFLEMLALGVDREGSEGVNFNYSTDE